MRMIRNWQQENDINYLYCLYRFDVYGFCYHFDSGRFLPPSKKFHHFQEVVLHINTNHPYLH